MPEQPPRRRRRLDGAKVTQGNRHGRRARQTPDIVARQSEVGPPDNRMREDPEITGLAKAASRRRIVGERGIPRPFVEVKTGDPDDILTQGMTVGTLTGRREYRPEFGGEIATRVFSKV